MDRPVARVAVRALRREDLAAPSYGEAPLVDAHALALLGVVALYATSVGAGLPAEALPSSTHFEDWRAGFHERLASASSLLGAPLSVEGSRFWIAVDESADETGHLERATRLAGFLCADTHAVHAYKMRTREQMIEVKHLYVQPAYQAGGPRRVVDHATGAAIGVGSALLRAFLDAARAARAAPLQNRELERLVVHLNVYRGTRAVDFYKKPERGFVSIPHAKLAAKARDEAAVWDYLELVVHETPEAHRPRTGEFDFEEADRALAAASRRKRSPDKRRAASPERAAVPERAASPGRAASPERSVSPKRARTAPDLDTPPPPPPSARNPLRQSVDPFDRIDDGRYGGDDDDDDDDDEAGGEGVSRELAALSLAPRCACGREATLVEALGGGRRGGAYCSHACQRASRAPSY